MRVILKSDKASGSLRAAEIIAQQIRQKPDSVLGLATGSSPLGCYQELIRMHRDEGLDFSKVKTFNLDEYIGLSPSDVQSYHYFMRENLFNHINLPKENINIPDGRAFDFQRFCDEYEKRIENAGGIDLQLLGIGHDGHIAFNEPGSSLGSRTRLKSLTSETVKANARFFESEADVPRLSITMGVGTILESKRCLLIAFGESKADAIAATVEGPVTSQITASALQLHRDVVVILDEGSSSKLFRRSYYEEVEQMQTHLEAGRYDQLGIVRSE